MKKYNKKIIGIIISILVIGLGTSFAFYNYRKLSKNSVLVTGDIYLKNFIMDQLMLKIKLF